MEGWNFALQAFQTLGLPIALCLFFIWQNKLNNDSSRRECLEREERLGKRLDDEVTFRRDTLVKLVEDNTKVLSRLEKHLDV